MMRFFTGSCRSQLLIAIAIALSLPTGARAQFDCPEGMVPLEEATKVAGNGPVCYRFVVPEASPFVSFQVGAGTPLDLYFTEGIQESLSDWDRVNVGPIQGDTKLMLLQPSAGDYTVAVAPGTEAGIDYTLLASAVAAEVENLEVCFEETGECFVAVPMMSGPRGTGIELGGDDGDRVIFPMTIEAPGTVTVSVSWEGDAERLALILGGPLRPELSNPAAYYARADGRSPLKLEYAVSSDDLERGKRFQVSVVNFGGGTARGQIDIRTSKPVKFNFRRLTTVERAAMPMRMTPVAPSPGSPGATSFEAKPTKPLLARPLHAPNQTRVCFDAVQDKIPWNYEGAKRWGTANLQRLCRGTTKGSEPARCFRQVMHGGVNWGGGTRWKWENAIDLCEGTNDAARTVGCFKRARARGRTWRQAIASCETR